MDESSVTAMATLALAFFGAVQIFKELYSARASKSLAAKERAFDQINRHVFDNQIVEMFERWRVINAKYENNVLDFDTILASYKRHKEYVAESATLVAGVKHDYDWIIQLLNFYEQISIGIRHGTVDEETYKEWWRTSLVLDWLNAKSFVLRFREVRRTQDAFVNFEYLATRWKLLDDEKVLREN